MGIGKFFGIISFYVFGLKVGVYFMNKEELLIVFDLGVIGLED